MFLSRRVAAEIVVRRSPYLRHDCCCHRVLQGCVFVPSSGGAPKMELQIPIENTVGECIDGEMILQKR